MTVYNSVTCPALLVGGRDDWTRAGNQAVLTVRKGYSEREISCFYTCNIHTDVNRSINPEYYQPNEGNEI
jgi:hypothetical protein